MKKIPLLLSVIITLLLSSIIGIFFYNKYQETQLEKQKIKLEMEKLKKDNKEKKDGASSKKSEKKSKDIEKSNNEKISTSEETLKESVLTPSGSWNGDSTNLGFDVHSPSSSRTAILKSPDSTYYVMPEEYEQAKAVLYNLYALDENGNEDCENVNSKCYNDQHKDNSSSTPKWGTKEAAAQMTKYEAESAFWDVMDGRNLNPEIDHIVENESTYDVYYSKNGSNDASNVVIIERSTGRAHGADLGN
ncbi:hypothetical protein [Macrococcus equi]|uniref:hypothetical protein n=1 Tax=Macrococcus equi TaxID=3395462 RepID=UPI0039BE248E